MIDIKRCNELIEGDEPENEAESLFVCCFSAALNGEDLNDCVIEMDAEFNLAGVQELEMIIAGYGAGQKQRKIELGMTEEIH